MNELDFLSKVWGENTEANPNDMMSNDNAPMTNNSQIIKKLKKLDFLQKRVNIMKVVAIILLLTSFVVSVNMLNKVEPVVYIGISVVILSTVIFMWYYFKNQFSTSKLDYTLTPAQFAKETVKALKNQNRIFGLPFILFILGLIVGVNILFLGMTPESGAAVTDSADVESFNPLYFHIIFSLLVALGGFLGMQVRKWRIRKEVTPLIEELNKLESSYNN